MKSTKLFLVIVLAGMLAGLVGCGDITGRGPAPLDRTVGPATQEYARVGHIYCMRGWLGIFSTGMDSLADKIDKQVGVPAVSVADEEWHTLEEWLVAEKKKGEINEPLVLLGHSYGADDQIRIAQELKAEGISVDLLVAIDPVTPPSVPSNVKRVYCVYMSHPMTDWYPAWRGVPVTVDDAAATPLVNIDIRTDKVGIDTSTVNHGNIEKCLDVHKMVMEEIKKTCPLRSAWVPSHSTTGMTQVPVPTKMATP